MTSIDFYTQLDGVSQYLRAFAVSLTKDPSSACDLYQDTVYKALRNKDKFKVGTNFKAWITTIMRNTFINDLRRKKISKTSTEPFDNPFLIENSGTVDNNAVSQVTIKELQILIDMLPVQMSRPFLMYLYGYAYQEISTELQIPLGTVKSRIFFARKELQKLVIKYYPELSFRLNVSANFE